MSARHRVFARFVFTPQHIAVRLRPFTSFSVRLRIACTVKISIPSFILFLDPLDIDKCQNSVNEVCLAFGRSVSRHLGSHEDVKIGAAQLIVESASVVVCLAMVKMRNLAFRPGSDSKLGVRCSRSVFPSLWSFLLDIDVEAATLLESS